MKKKNWAIVLTIILLTLLTACSTEENESNSIEANKSENTTEITESDKSATVKTNEQPDTMNEPKDAEIIKIYKEQFPALRFIGKPCTGDIGHHWEEWFENDWFEPLNALGKVDVIGDGAVGFMVDKPEFVYWIGMFVPAGSEVPDGYDYMDFKESDVGMCQIKGTDENFYQDWKWIQAIRNEGMGNFKEGMYYFQYYDSQRYNEEDEYGNVILDFGIYLE